jgi:ribosomal protein S27AE
MRCRDCDYKPEAQEKIELYETGEIKSVEVESGDQLEFFVCPKCGGNMSPAGHKGRWSEEGYRKV